MLTGLEAALTRMDDSDDESQLTVPTWRDGSGTEGHGHRSVRARIGDVASPVACAPLSSLLGALLESDDEPLVRLVPTTRRGLSA